MAYATPEDMLARFDARTIGDLVSDTGTRVAAGDLPTNVNLLAILDSASGMIDAALMAGGQYSAADLAGLTGNSAALLTKIASEIAMADVYGRRPLYNLEAYRAMREIAESILEALRTGKNVLGIQANIDAGAPTIDGPTTIEYKEMNLVRDRVKYYPKRFLPHNR